MRQLITLLLLLPLAAQSQTYRLVTVLMEKHKLNSGTRSAVGGRSRITLPVKAPPRTKYLYYSISTSENDQSVTLKNGIKLARQLGTVLDGKPMDAASMANAAASIRNQEQDGAIDVYRLGDANQCRAFEQKQDQQWRYYADDSRYNFSGGTVGIAVPYSFNEQYYYFGFKNPSSYKAQWFNIEVVALVEK